MILRACLTSVAVRRCLAAGLLIVLFGVPARAQKADAYFEFLMARRLEGQGDQEGAFAALQRAVAADPGSAELKVEVATFHLRRDQQNEAQFAALDALKLDDDNVGAHRVLGLIFAAKLDELSPTTAPNQIEKTAKDAIRHLERAVGDSIGTVDPSLQYALGRVYLRTGETPRAVEAFARVVDLNPGSAQGRLSLAQAYAAADDLNNAIATLDVIAADEPSVASTLAQYQEQAGLLDDAVDSYTLALTVEPGNTRLKVRRIATAFNAKDYVRAAEYSRDAQNDHPEDLRFPRLRARALFEIGEVGAAVTVLETAAKTFSKDVSTQLALANIYSDAGRDADAERTLRRMLDLDPANAEANNTLGYMLAERGQKLDEAVRLVERALVADPNNPSYLDSLGWAHFKRGNLELAEKYMTPAAERLPRNSVVQDHLGDVLARRGRLADAISAWTRALAGEGDDIDRAAVEKKINDARTRLTR